MPFKATMTPPIMKGRDMLRLCIMYPPIAGAKDLKLILARLLNPTAEALSEGSTMLTMKACLIGMVIVAETLYTTRRNEKPR